MNGRTHAVVGAAIGAGSVIAFRKVEAKPIRIGELAGGVLGGIGGAMFPDIVEPATSSYHRGFAHSASLSAAAVSTAVTRLGSLRNWMDCKADLLRAKAQAAEDALDRFLYYLAAFLVDFATGALTAFVPGYASHVVLDAMTPRGIPILGFSHSC